MVRRALARSIFALAALSALAAGVGVAVPAHIDAPGAPLYHGHVLGAYRFAFLVLPAEVARPVSVEMTKLHETLMRAGVPMGSIMQMPGMDRSDATGLPTIRSTAFTPVQDLAIELALLVVVVARLSRPTLRAVATMPVPRIAADLWRRRPDLAPPRSVLLSV